ncbi:hypothetical protein C0993_006182 [Termitomyces sp. T159_Od127]|nr:hypothetical protein C0993_006182 [Termitomyces sp. T159_Od127]
MPYHSHGVVAGITMEDDLGITYLVENAQQFWSELEDMLNFNQNDIPTLAHLDSTLRRSLALCTAYHEQYLQSPLQLEHACELLMESELFRFHSERMCEILLSEIQSQTNPHAQFIFYHVLLCYGRRKTDFFRSHKRWQPLLPLLMDHILVEIDPDVEDAYFGVTGASDRLTHVPIPIEAKLRGLGIQLLYEVCRVQKFSVQDLRIFEDAFIDYLFDLVEQTRHMHNETFNYSVIKLIVTLNEQFMVASLNKQVGQVTTELQLENRVLAVLMRRLWSSKTFGENMIFMLNRAERTPEDLCMQLLILKLLYVLFTTEGTSEYFYTNDLCVLVDVFLRELVDLDEDSESLRHTYLRVLHPLLVRTQLRDMPYKRPQIAYALESLVAHSKVRDVNPTTKRLVERCLSGDWCVNLPNPKAKNGAGAERSASPAVSEVAMNTITSGAAQLQRSNSKKLKASRSVENLRVRTNASKPPLSPDMDNFLCTKANNASATSISGVAHASPTNHNRPPPPRRQFTANSVQMDGHHPNRHPSGLHVDADFHHHHHQLIPPTKPSLHTAAGAKGQPPRRSAPPPPPKRRQPPAIPTQVTHGGATIMTIKSSAPMSQVKMAQV